MTYEEERIIGTAIGRAYLEGAMWMLDARHNDDLSVRMMNEIATKYTTEIIEKIKKALAQIETIQ